MTERSQALEGYGCKCGFKTDDLKTFQKHLHSGGRAQKGIHASSGRVNMETGEIIMPPWTERTSEQKQATRYAVKKQKDIDIKKDTTPKLAAKTTEVLSQAQQINFVPRVFTCDYSPIMRAAVDASQRLFGWPSMSFGDFLDTVLWKYFKRCGVTLAGFIIDETEEERKKREEALAAIKLERESKEAKDVETR